MLVVDTVYRKHGKDLVITSVSDGRHSSGSHHYKGLSTAARDSSATTRL